MQKYTLSTPILIVTCSIDSPFESRLPQHMTDNEKWKHAEKYPMNITYNIEFITHSKARWYCSIFIITTNRLTYVVSSQLYYPPRWTKLDTQSINIHPSLRQHATMLLSSLLPPPPPQDTNHA